MIKFNNIIKTETFIELDGDNGSKMLMPASQTIFVDDNSGAISVKTTGSRKTLGYMVSGGTPPVPPTFSGKWLATYEDTQQTIIESAECDSSSAITEGEIRQNVISVEIGDCVTTIGNNCFFNCYNITDIILPNNITSIGEGAFRDCFRLTSVIIPSGVTSIGDGAFRSNRFQGGAGITNITIMATTPPTLGLEVFKDTPLSRGDGLIYVPAASVEAYKSAPNWSNYASRIQAIQ